MISLHMSMPLWPVVWRILCPTCGRQEDKCVRVGTFTEYSHGQFHLGRIRAAIAYVEGNEEGSS